MKKLDNELLNKVQKFIDVAGVNKTKFAQSAGISPFSLYMWLNGKRRLSPATLEKINDCLSRVNLALN